MISVNQDEQKRHWEHIERRRSPDYPVIKAYSSRKLELIYSRLGLDLNGRESLRLLEVGAGNGFFSVGLMEKFDVTCSDFSNRMLALHPFPPERKIVADACDLPFSNEKFDLVFCANLLHHIDHPEAAVKEMARVASKRVILIEPNARNPLMAAFGLAVREERGTLRFTSSFVEKLCRDAGLCRRFLCAHGALLPNKTPKFLLRPLSLLDRAFPLGFYVVGVFDKK